MVLTPTSYYKDKYGNVLETPRNQFAKNNAEFDELSSYELSPRKTDGNNTYVFEYAQLSEGVGESKTFVKELGKSEIIDGVFKMPEVQDVRVTEDHPVIELYYALDNNGSGGTSDNIPDYKENDVTYKRGKRVY